MGELIGKKDRRNHTVGGLQTRFKRLIDSINGIVPDNKNLQMVVATREVIMGDPAEWKFKNFRQPASDLLFMQNGRSVCLKTYLPGDYWIYLTRYSRKDLEEGEEITGRSKGKYIYIPDFADDTTPTQLENDTVNVIAVHEAAHQVDNKKNQSVYRKLYAKLKKVNPKGSKYMSILREITTRQELGSLELLLKTLKDMEQDGVTIFTSSSDQLRALLLGGLKSQGWLLNIELPKV